MPEQSSDKKIFTLLEVTRSIQKTIAERYKSTFWVKAEMIKLNLYSHSGHCYPDLVEKNNGRVVAQLRANLWKTDYDRVNRQFLKVLREPIRDGITILFKGSISFDTTHGLCLRIHDIDPVFSLGELEREKLETISKLNEEEIFSLNKQKALPILPQRIAVISVETSKGYADYCKVINENPWGYKFVNILFPSILQGEKAIDSILYQLSKIRRVLQHFDAVAIIRGGGGDVGLSSFNNYHLAKAIATYPIPVLTGIGHSTNETVCEMVSHKNAITPTELADFLIQKFHNFAKPVEDAESIITTTATKIISDTSMQLNQSVRSIKVSGGHLLQRNRFQLDAEHARLTNMSRKFVVSEQHALALLEKHVSILDPANLLRKGFSITLDKNGKPISSITQVAAGATIRTIVSDGEIQSDVKSINNNE